ncbi:hypothetical protein MLP_08540 [Microlunatus phosphovorus NM-1]|uniref:NB-ARC domain-containing protein n=1 Tax=Microlunatus phosphovorus (strain ATCC 700054 / DSM 10555 / JCM 9379 / NBRC 101784 / NCIMB 13414 / VKM Ac-1990 / NM-1) TaxID=1032480 RepID=F5XLY9_MICPN|nr:ATP-binding protein [Microlunatus phosphovorus]BAK33868.1 hypothetical protein MLP_08540 [Microlunatus phosphovorus NM-1]
METSASGGVGSAAGLGFQYLAALQALIDQLESSCEDFVLGTEHETHDAIDYTISRDGRVLVAAQAKGAVDGAGGRPLGPSEVIRIGIRLAAVAADEYRIDTNRRLFPATKSLLAALQEGALRSASDVQALLSRCGTAADVSESLSPDRLLALNRLQVVYHDGTNFELVQRLTDRILEHRRSRLQGAGSGSARVLLGYLVAEMLFLSGRRSDRCLDRDAATALLRSPSHALAGALGRYDWGEVIGPVPVCDRVTRSDVLDAIMLELQGPPRRAAPRLLSINGFSGAGKSIAVATFVELTASRYDRIVWFDAGADSSMRALAHSVLERIGRQPGTDVAAAFRDCIGESADQWLLVFDNAVSARDLDPWVPAYGHVDVIATSTSTSTWSTWRRLSIEGMARIDALELVRIRLQQPCLNDHERRLASELVLALDRWPLAIELACAHLVQSGRRLSVTSEYLARIRSRVISDEELTPPSYRTHATLLGAVFVALEDTLARSVSRYELAPSELLDFIAYLPPLHAPATIAANAIWSGHATGEEPGSHQSRADQDLLLDESLRGLARSSLVQIQQDPAVGPCIRMNSIVAEIVRDRQDASTVERVLKSLQLTIDSVLRKALVSERYLVAGALIPSGRHVLRHALEAQALTLNGLTLLGNEANYALRIHDFEWARSHFELQLDLLDKAELDSPVLRAKIFASLALCELSLNTGESRVFDLIDRCLAACEQVLSSDAQAKQVLVEPATQLLEVMAVLEFSPACDHGPKVQDWTRRLSALDLEVGPSTLAKVSRALSSPDNNDVDTLTELTEAIAGEAGTYNRMQLSFVRAETLTVLGRYTEAAQAFKALAEEANVRGLGLSSGWVEILNAWRRAAIDVLSQDVAEAHQLCTVLDVLVGDAAPGTEEDRAHLVLCRAATSVQREPAEHVTYRMNDLAETPFSTSMLVSDTTAAELMRGACSEVARMRQRFDWAPIIGYHSWARGELNGIPCYFFGLGADLDLIRSGDDLCLSYEGAWVVSESGVGLYVASPQPVLIWKCTSEGGWLRKEAFPLAMPVVKLRERVAGGISVPTHVLLLGVEDVTSSVASEPGTMELHVTATGVLGL